MLPVVLAMCAELDRPSLIVTTCPPTSHPVCDKVVTISSAKNSCDLAKKPFAAMMVSTLTPVDPPANTLMPNPPTPDHAQVPV